ncbi:MAG: sulfite exporter TauE/SafE family protein [Crocinitomicaceae bacterium]
MTYGAVGYGGASGYLALMGLFSFVPDEMRPTALVLNLFVAGIAFIHFARLGYFKFKTFAIFAAASIPMAFLGGTFNIETGLYKVILGIFLLLSVAKMVGLLDEFLNKGDYDSSSKRVNLPLGLGVGAGIGFFSGLIGIGGGIILSPILLLSRWANAKETAAISALFIWVNSVAGLSGQYYHDELFLNEQLILMIILVVAGGFIGGYIGAKKLNNKKLRYLLSLMLFVAALKLILGQ